MGIGTALKHARVQVEKWRWKWKWKWNRESRIEKGSWVAGEEGALRAA